MAREIPIKVTVDGREAKRGTDQATSSLNNLKRRADETGRSTSAFQQRLNRLGGAAQRVQSSVASLKGALVGLGAALATRQLVRFTQQALKTAESISDVSQRTGIAAERLQGLRRAFDQNGGSAQRLDSALSRFNRRIGLAAQGGGAASDAVERFNVSLRDARGNARDTGAVLNDVIKVIQNIESSSERAAVASRFFGEEAGPALAPLLAQGTNAINQYTEQLREAGVLFRGELVQSAGQASASLRRFSDDVSQAFQIGLLESFVSETGRVEDSLKSLRTSARDFGEAAGNALTVAAQAAQKLSDNLDLVITALSATAAGRFLRVFGRLTQLFGAAATAAFTYQQRVGEASSASDTLRQASQRLQGILNSEVGAQSRAAQATRQATREKLEAAKATLSQIEAQRQLNQTVTEGQQRPGANVAREQGEQVAELRSEIENLEAGLARLNTDALFEDVGNSADTAAEFVSELNKQFKIFELASKANADGADQTASAFQNVTESLRQEIELVGATREERRLSNALRQAGADLTEEQRQRIVELVGELESEQRAQERANETLRIATEGYLDLQNASMDAGNAVEDATEDATDSTRDLGIEAQSTADIMRGAFEEVGRSIQSGIADALRGAGGNLVDQAKNIAANLAAAFATQRIIIPAVIQPVAGALGLGGGSSSAAAGQGGSGATGSIGNAVSAGSLLSNIGSGLTTPTFSAGGLANFAPSIFGTQAASGGQAFANSLAFGGSAAPNGLATGLSNLSTPLGIGGGLIGGLASSLVFENNLGNTIGSSVGGIGGGVLGGSLLAGTAIGGPIGAGIGALVGAFGGGGLGSLFGGQSVPSRAIDRGIGFRDGRFVGTFANSDEASGKQVEAFDKIQDTVAQQLNAFAQSIPGSISDAPSTKISQTRREGIRAGRAGVSNEDQRQFDSLEEAVNFALSDTLRNAKFEGLKEDAKEALERSLDINDGDLRAVAEDVNFAQNFEDRIEALNKGVQSLSDTISGQAEQSLDQTTDSLREFIDTTRELGLNVIKAREATTGFVKRLIGIQDQQQEKLSQAGAQVVRLREFQRNAGQLAAPTNLTGKQVQNALGQRINEVQAQRRRQLIVSTFEQDIQQAVGGIANFLENEREALIQDVRQGTISKDLFNKVVENRLEGQIEGLDLKGLQRVRGIIKQFSDVIPASSRAIRNLNERIDDLKDSAQDAGNALSSQQIADAQLQFPDLFPGQQGAGAQITSAGLPGTSLGKFLLNPSRLGALNRGLSDQEAQQFAQSLKTLTNNTEASGEDFTNALSILADNTNTSAEQAKQNKQEVVNSRQTLIGQLEQEKQQVEQTAQSFRRIGEELDRFQSSIQFSNNSPLSPQKQLQEARGEFQTTRRKALGIGQFSDISKEDQIDAQQRLPDVASTFLDEARSFFASGEGFQNVFNLVNSTIDAVEKNAGQQLSEAEQQVNALEIQISNQESLIREIQGLGPKVDTVAEAIKQVNDSVTNLRDVTGNSDAGGPLAGGSRNAAYLSRNPDVAKAVNAGNFDSGLDHFLQFGLQEGRTFAQGGVTSPGSNLVHGNEAIFTSPDPALVMNAQQLQQGARQDSATAEEVRALREEVRALRQATVVSGEQITQAVNQGNKSLRETERRSKLQTSGAK